MAAHNIFSVKPVVCWVAIAATSIAFFGSARKSWASSSAFSQAFATSGRCLIRSARIVRKAPSFSFTVIPEAMRLARPSCTSREAVGSQITAASSLPARKPLVMTSMFWFSTAAGVTPSFLKASCAKRSAQLPSGTAMRLPSSHLMPSLALANFGASGRARKMLHWSVPRPTIATMRMSATSCLVVETMAGMSPT